MILLHIQILWLRYFLKIEYKNKNETVLYIFIRWNNYVVTFVSMITFWKNDSEIYYKYHFDLENLIYKLIEILDRN